MKKGRTSDSGTDANAVLKKHLTNVQRRKRKRIITITIIIVLIAGAIVFTVFKLRDSVSENYGAAESNVEAYIVITDSISTTLSGSGTLSDDDVEDIELPASVDIDTVFFEEGDTVNEGDMIASVNAASVISAMADIQSEIDEIDDSLEDASDDTVSSKIKAGVSGRVKMIYAQTGDDIATVMYDHGALMLISLDGLMAADIETDKTVSVGDTVDVTLSDASVVSGTVVLNEAGAFTVTVTDNGTEYGDVVTVSDSQGAVLGTGTLYIHSELRVTGYAGTVSKVYVGENKKVSSASSLFYLKDTSYTAGYETLLKQRAELEEDLNVLIDLYKQGAVLSPISGVIYSLDTDEDTSDTEETAEGQDPSDEKQDTVAIGTVCPNATMSVSVDMDESDILSLAVGQEAAVTIDSIGDDEFTGTVTDIDTSGTSSGGVTVFAIEVTIDKTDNMLAGMSVSVAIKIDGVDNALVIPEDALQQTSTTAYVYTEYDEETGELGGIVEVIAGLSNGTYVEISSGLAEGDVIYYELVEVTDIGFSFSIDSMQGDFQPRQQEGVVPSMPDGAGMPGQ